ncbi:hypothetical protein [Cyclobacterium plantarum]|uniref:hypothetical protein n=1 Tax=Cyclobacterium plantarum TaxID=2716263 RepID=UPI003F714EC8
MLSPILRAQEKGEIKAYRLKVNESPVMDGRLDESFWKQVNTATSFRQQEPLEGQLATEQTAVQVAFDEKNLYLGVRMYDSEPGNIKAYQRRRDADLATG